MTATRSTFTSRTRKGFTLVEILIVVIILGILAAIVIPQFTNASTDARKSNMASQDQTCKSQISLYSLQHNDTYPTLANLWTDLTSISDANGNIPPASGAQPFGPYLQSTPTNPLTSTSVVADIGSPAATVGWVYSATTGEFHGVNSVGAISDDGN
jgi:general secretion pathway protein G